MNVPACEDVWNEVTKNPKTKYVIGTVYRHPQQKFQTFEAAFVRNLKLSKTLKKYVVMGDFNIDYNCYHMDNFRVLYVVFIKVAFLSLKL